MIVNDALAIIIIFGTMYNVLDVASITLLTIGDLYHIIKVL